MRPGEAGPTLCRARGGCHPSGDEIARRPPGSEDDDAGHRQASPRPVRVPGQRLGDKDVASVFSSGGAAGTQPGPHHEEETTSPSSSQERKALWPVVAVVTAPEHTGGPEPFPGAAHLTRAFSRGLRGGLAPLAFPGAWWGRGPAPSLPVAPGTARLQVPGLAGTVPAERLAWRWGP